MNNTIEKPTLEIANSFQTAFDYFNKHLFENELPQANITLNRKEGANGYYSKERFIERSTSTPPIVWGNALDEIAMNPDTFGRSDKQILATLVHEMCHHWQFHHGISKAKTPGYHNKEWAKKMVKVGLLPISKTTGSKGTGLHVGTEIIGDEKFDKLCTEFLAKYPFDLKYASKFSGKKKERKTHTKYSFRYECPLCNNWAKAPIDTNIVCGDCIEPMANVDLAQNVEVSFNENVISGMSMF